MVVTGPRTLADYLAVQKTITGILDSRYCTCQMKKDLNESSTELKNKKPRQWRYIKKWNISTKIKRKKYIGYSRKAVYYGFFKEMPLDKLKKS
jgi:hypothetical protein